MMEESSTRQSSKLSLGSSPSVLSGEEDPLDLDDCLSLMDEDVDLLSPLSILHTGSPGSLSNEEVLDDETSERDDSASSLSSAPEDLPLSRSASPEQEENGKKRKSEQTDEGPLKKLKKENPLTDEENENHTMKKHYETDKRQQNNSIKIEEVERTSERDDQEDREDKEEDKKDEKKTKEEKEEKKIEGEAAENDEDYQQRHKEALDALTHIELEFARLRDKMYQEKMSELNDEAVMIANGTHPELVSLMAEIEEKKGKRISSAEAWRRHQYSNFKRQYEGFEYQANIHFMSQKNALRRDLLGSINSKKWSVESERKKLNELPADRLFPDGREMILHKREMKEETSELIEIKESVGFPMAPNPRGLTSQDIDEDLRLLGIHNS